MSIDQRQEDKMSGFPGTVWKHRVAVFASWDIYLALVIGALLAFFSPKETICQNFSTVLGAELGIASALVGVILAGLAIITVFLDKDYIAVLSRVGHGFAADIFPFWFTAFLAVASIVINVISLLLEGYFEVYTYRLILGLSSWVFLWTLFASLNLVAFISGHASNRSYQILNSTKK